jgi:Rps23 Pro-64 3,4-dihydroxylase Tpa1-like proline 4-hydroxylase
VLSHPCTKQFVEAFSGKDCPGKTKLEANLYKPGNFSAPHNDKVRNVAHTVAFI